MWGLWGLVSFGDGKFVVTVLLGLAECHRKLVHSPMSTALGPVIFLCLCCEYVADTMRAWEAYPFLSPNDLARGAGVPALVLAARPCLVIVGNHGRRPCPVTR